MTTNRFSIGRSVIYIFLHILIYQDLSRQDYSVNSGCFRQANTSRKGCSVWWKSPTHKQPAIVVSEIMIYISVRKENSYGVDCSFYGHIIQCSSLLLSTWRRIYKVETLNTKHESIGECTMTSRRKCLEISNLPARMKNFEQSLVVLWPVVVVFWRVYRIRTRKGTALMSVVWISSYILNDHRLFRNPRG